MGLALVLLILGIGSTVAAALHLRDSSRGKPLQYPLLYDLLGAAGFLAFGIGSLLGIPSFTGSGRVWLLVLLPIAVDKWRRALAGRRRGRKQSGGRQRRTHSGDRPEPRTCPR
jgi:hypothetical protein